MTTALRVSLITFLLATCNNFIAAGGVEECSPELPPKLPKLQQGLIYNQDVTQFFGTPINLDDIDGGHEIDLLVDQIASAGVKTLMWNTNDQKTSYHSDTWLSIWEDEKQNYDPKGGNTQPFLEPIPELNGERADYHHVVHNGWALDKQGVDHVARFIIRSRCRGMSPWVSIRMNDVHNNEKMEHPFHANFWRAEERWRGGSLPYFERGLDWRRDDVRDKYFDLVVETLKRYDIDGLELDFMREPYLFSDGQEFDGALLLTGWLRKVHKLLDETAAERGHSIALGVRVPSRFAVAQGWGLNVVEWAKAGLVNLVVVTPRWATLEFDMPMADWKALLGSTGVTLAGGLEVRYQPVERDPENLVTHLVTPAEAIGAATTVLTGGSDAVYLYNYSLNFADSRLWSSCVFQNTLKAMNSLQDMMKLTRTHALTPPDVFGPHEVYKFPLPVVGTNLSFNLPSGPDPGANAQVSLELTASILPAMRELPSVKINGVDAKWLSTNTSSVVTLNYMLPSAALMNQRALVEVVSKEELKIMGVEIKIVP